VTADSKTQSVIPDAAGRDVSPKSPDAEYDVNVAMHDYGKGTIAYFGDVNGEDQTLWLVSAFVESRTPRLPIDCFASLDESVFSKVLQLKTEGNDAFQKGNLDVAKDAYEAAIQQYGTKLGSNGLQRETHVTVLSNLSLIHLKKKEYLEAERVATKALDMDWSHNKCSYRRAMARLQISKSASSGGDLARLRGAKKDVINGDPIDATRKLLQRIENEIDRIEKKDHARFGSGFASALSRNLA
jgi:tetratricopeptide (TPR) repeat protein